MTKMEKIYFQWLPNTIGDGSVVYLSDVIFDEDDIYYEFSDGNMCNKMLIAEFTKNKEDLANKAMVMLSSKNDPWKFSENEVIKSKPLIEGVSKRDGEKYEIPDYEDYSGKKIQSTLKMTPPAYNSTLRVSMLDIDEMYMQPEYEEEIAVTPKAVQENITKDVPDNKSEGHQVVEIVDNNCNTNKAETKNDNINITTDPVAILVNSSAKYDSTIVMELNIDLPAKSLFNIAKDNFDNGETKFIDVILSSISYDIVKESLRNALLNAYNEQ